MWFIYTHKYALMSTTLKFPSSDFSVLYIYLIMVCYGVESCISSSVVRVWVEVYFAVNVYRIDANETGGGFIV